MKIHFEYHPENFLILPLLGLAAGECDDPQCTAEHWMISAGWFCWTFNVVLEAGGGDAA